MAQSHTSKCTQIIRTTTSALVTSHLSAGLVSLEDTNLTVSHPHPCSSLPAQRAAEKHAQI